METTENPEMVKIEIEIHKDLADFAEFYAKLCGMEKERLIRRALTTELNTYKTKVLELPLITERHTKSKKNWQI